MIIKLKKSEIDKYLNFAYDLSQDISKSSFPIYKDTIKSKADFNKIAFTSFTEENSEILLFKQQDEICGWIHYYWLEADKYMGIEVFNILHHYDMAIKEFIAYSSKRFKGYRLYFGVPKANKEAVKTLSSLGKLEEKKAVFVLHLKNYKQGKKSPAIKKITMDNYHDFKALHDIYHDMYWNSDRLYDALLGKTKNPWHIYGFYDKDGLLASIYFTYYREMAEIFGLDFKNDTYNNNIAQRLLVVALNKMQTDQQKYLTYFADDKEYHVLRELGMNYITDYILYVIDII